MMNSKESPRLVAEARRQARGQSTVEYVAFCAALLGASTVGWPYLVMLLNALNRYFQSVYYVIQSPLL